MPAKARRVALRTELAGKLADNELVIAELPTFEKPSSKSAREMLKALGAPRRALVVLDKPDANLWKSLRNFPGVSVRTAAELCAHDVVAGGLVVAEKGAMNALADRVGAKVQEVPRDEPRPSLPRHPGPCSPRRAPTTPATATPATSACQGREQDRIRQAVELFKVRCSGDTCA
jgi:hypothetical protein